MERTAHASAGVLKQLGVAIKASALYPPSHPGNAQAVEALLKALHAFMEAHGSFRVNVGKQTFSVDGVSVEGQSNPDLAYSLYSRKLVQFTILPSVSQSQLAAFVTKLGMDRTKLEEAGGLAHLLRESGVEDIQVRELSLDADEEVAILGLNAFFSLLGRGRLNPEERERVTDILHSGPEQTVRLLQNVHGLAGEVLEGVDEEGQVQQVYQSIRGLDRLIVDEPFDQQQPLYANLAEAILRLEDPLRPRVMGALLSGAREDSGAQVVLEHFSSDQLAEIIRKSSGEGNIVEQIVPALRASMLDPEKVRHLLSLLESQPSQVGESGGLLDAGLHELQAVFSGAADTDAPAVEIEESQVAIPEEDLERCLSEARSVDEAGAVREGIRTCVDLLANAVEQKDLVEVAETLAADLSWLLEHREFVLLREVLAHVKAMASTARGERAEIINGILRRVTEDPLLERLLAALWEGRTTPAEQEIQDCMEVLAGELIGPLVRVLGTDSRGGMRAMLTDFLVRVGPEHVDEFGAFVADGREHVVRHIASILGRIRAPQGVAHLARLVNHWDARVRAQALDALVSIGTEAAQAVIGEFLNDPEQKIRLRALKALKAQAKEVATPSLLAILECRDPFNRLFTLREAGIEAVARLGIGDALPALERLARARFVFGRRGRELRRLARAAAATLAGVAMDNQAAAPAKVAMDNQAAAPAEREADAP